MRRWSTRLTRAIGDYHYSRFFTFDVTGISLESPVILRGTAKEFSPAGLVPILLFFGRIAEKGAEQVGGAAITFFQSSQESLQKHQDKMPGQAIYC